MQAVPQAGMEQRHAEKVEAVRGGKFDLLLIGDSITQNLENPEFRGVWDRFFAPRRALDLGYGGGRTENILWNLTHGELDGQSPKVVTLLIGTNDSDDANYPLAHTPEQIVAGTTAVIGVIREKCPDTKILLLRVFPRTNVYRNEDGTERGSAEKRAAANFQAGDIAARLADDKSVFYLDVNHVFLRLDGSIDPDLMPDLLHPSAKGTLAWAEAMEPLLATLFGDAPRRVAPANTALLPLPKIEPTSYDWWQRHGTILQVKNEIDPEIVLIGDSITHLWGGPPIWACDPNGPRAFAKTFEGRRVLNLGYGNDRVQNVLWRLDHGEIEGLHLKTIVLNIGAENLRATPNAAENTPGEISEAICAALLRLRAKAPQSRLILMGLFPQGEKADVPLRAKISGVNERLKAMVNGTGILYLDIGEELTQPDGTISPEIMRDFLHPTERGYEIWGDALSAAGF